MTVLVSVLAASIAWLLAVVGVSATAEKGIWLSMGPAILFAFTIGWPIARRLGMSPLMIFAGPCPACQRRPEGWWSSGSNSELLQLRCGACGEGVIVWLVPPSRAALLRSGVQMYVLRWPQFLGVWRRVDSAARQNN